MFGSSARRQLGLFKTPESKQTEITPQQRNREYVEQARKLGRSIVISKGEATTNDIKERLPVPEGVNPAILGRVFNTPEYRSIGIKRRLYSKGGGGYVQRWTFRDDR